MVARRIRRSRSVAPLVLALAACSACSAGASGTTPSSPASSSSAPSSSASATTTAASPSPSAVAALEVTLSVTSPAGARSVAVTADVQGTVPQVLDGDGTPLSAADTEVMGTRVEWGDGGTDGSDPGDVSCSTTGALVPLTESFPLTHTYAKAGSYTMTFTAGACAPLKDTTRTVTVVVR